MGDSEQPDLGSHPSLTIWPCYREPGEGEVASEKELCKTLMRTWRRGSCSVLLEHPARAILSFVLSVQR